ncbi:MAG: hypothetical protein ACI90U_001061 [Pseudomonadales bacterium]|jgi:hypothetical protein
MKVSIRTQLSTTLVAILGVMIGTSSLATTRAGDDIINKAVLNFNIGSTFSLNSAPLGNNITIESGLAGFGGENTVFEIGRKIDFNVDIDGADVADGEADFVLTFTVINNSMQP